MIIKENNPPCILVTCQLVTRLLFNKINKKLQIVKENKFSIDYKV